MNRYRAYMDRIHAPSGLRYRVLEAAERGERPRRTPHRWIRAGALAACLVLVCTGIAGVHAALWPDPTAGVAETPAVTAASPAPAETEHTLVVESAPFDGQPHGFFGIPALEFADCTNSTPLTIDWGRENGSFQEAMTADEIIQSLGGTDAVPWALLWDGFALDGTAIYDGEGQLYWVVITGIRGEERLRLELAPGQLPPGGVSYADAAVQDVNGTPVTAYFLTGCTDTEDGSVQSLYTYVTSFLSGGTDVYFEYLSPDSDNAAWMSSVLVWNGTCADSSFTTEHLRPRIPPISAAEEFQYNTLPGSVAAAPIHGASAA